MRAVTATDAKRSCVMSFSAKLNSRIRALDSRVCVGLDPDLALFPTRLLQKYELENLRALRMEEPDLARVSECIAEFTRLVIDAVHTLAVAVKPQSAHYECYGYRGIHALEQTIVHARSRGLVVILDAKRNDIGSTAEKYALAYLGDPENPGSCAISADALTINPYLGSDGVLPFIKACEANGKGVFSLVKTSNPSSADIQDVLMSDGRPLFLHVAGLVDRWGKECMHGEYSCLGAVVGATWPEDIKKLRAIMPRAVFLMPGYGAQGAPASNLAAAFNREGLGAIVNSARGVIYNYDRASADFADQIHTNALLMKKDINTCLW